MKLSFSSIANLLLLPKNYNIAEYYQEVNEILQSHHVFNHLYQLEQSIQPILKQVERSGLIVASEWFTSGLQEKRNQLAHVGSEINQLIGSPNDCVVKEIALRNFWNDNDLPVANNFDSLRKYRHLHATFQLMLEYKNHQNYLKMWGERIRETGVSVDGGVSINGTWRSFTSYTGRITARNLPLTSLPIPMRDYVVSPKGYQIYSVDLINAELRFLAHYAKCDSLVQQFDKEIDVHAETTKLIRNSLDSRDINQELSRKLAKQFTYSLLYGAGTEAIRKNMRKTFHDVTSAEVVTLTEMFYQRYPELQRFLQERAEREKLLTPFGEITPVATFNKTQRKNFTLQSSVSVAIKVLLTTLARHDIKIIHVIHDEVWILVRDNLNLDDLIDQPVKEFKEKIKRYFPDLPINGILSKEKIGGK